AQIFPASGADTSCASAAEPVAFAASTWPGRLRLAQRLSVPAIAKIAASARPVRVCLAWRSHHAVAKGMAGVRSQRCIRIGSWVRRLFCGTGLVVVVIFFFLVAVAVFFFVWRDHFRRRGGDERVELLLGLVEDGADFCIEVLQDPVVRRAERVDVDGNTR